MDMMQILTGVLGKGGLSGLGTAQADSTTSAGSSGQGTTPQGGPGTSGLDVQSLTGLLGPAVLGGLTGALFSKNTGRGMAGGALLAGGGLMMWNKYKDQVKQVYDTVVKRSTTSAGSGQATQQNDDRFDWDTVTEPSTSTEGSPVQANRSDTVAQPATADALAKRATRIIRAIVFAAKSDGHIDDQEQAAIRKKLEDLNLGGTASDIIKEALDQPLDPALVADGVTDPSEALELFTLSCAVIDVDHFMEKSYLDALAKELHIPDEVKAGIEAHCGPKPA